MQIVANQTQAIQTPENKTPEGFQDIVFLSKHKNPITDSTKVAWKFQKRHDNVIRAIDDIISDLQDRILQSAENQNQHHLRIEEMFYPKNVQVPVGNGATREKKVYYMTEAGFTLLVMGFTGKKAIEFKMDFIEAFNRMKQQLATQKQQKEDALYYPKDYSEALRMLADQFDMNKKLLDQNHQLSDTLEQSAPKIEYYDQLVDINGYTNLRDTAKLIGMGEREFISTLVGMGWLYRDNKGDLKPHSDKIEKGFLTLKEWARKLNDPQHLGQKKEVTGTQARVTQKGREQLLKILKPKKEAA